MGLPGGGATIAGIAFAGATACPARSKPPIHTDALAPQPGAVRAPPAPDARVWAVVKANAYGHGIERVFDGLRGADGFALLDLAEAERVRALGWRGPILLLEGVFEPRDLELCSRLDLWHTVHCEEQIDMLAAHKTHAAAPRVPEDEQRHEPPGLHARGLPRRLARLQCAAAGRRDLADDAFQRCRRPHGHRRADGGLRGRHARPAGRAHLSATAPRRCAMPARPAHGQGACGQRRLGAPRHRCCTAARPTTRRTTPRTGTCSPP